MLLHVSTQDGVPLYLQIINQIKYLVASERLRPGDEVPPIRVLAEQLVINPNTVARAYRELETVGVLASKRGAGTYVSDRGSPLALEERERILDGRAKALLVEANQLGFSLEQVMDLVRRGWDAMAAEGASGEKDEGGPDT